MISTFTPTGTTIRTQIKIISMLLYFITLTFSHVTNAAILEKIDENSIKGLNKLSPTLIIQSMRNDSLLQSFDEIDSTLIDAINLAISKSEGFPFAKVTAIKQLENSDKIEITIDEGPYTLVKKIEIVGPELARELLKDTSTREQPFSTQWLNEYLYQLQEIMAKNGYPLAHLEVLNINPLIQQDTSWVDIQIDAIPGQKIIIRKVRFKAEKSVKHKLFERILDLDLPATYDVNSIERSCKNITQTGWYKEVKKPQLYKDKRGKFGLEYELIALQNNFILGSFGLDPESNNSDIAGKVDINLENIMGTGRSFVMNWHRESEYLQGFAVKYKEVYSFGLPVDWRITISQQSLDSTYTLLEFTTGVSYEFADDWSISGDLSYSDITQDSLSSSAIDDYNLNGGSVQIEYDSRLNRMNPRSGQTFTIYTSSENSSNKTLFDYVVKNKVTYSHHLPLNQSKVQQLFLSMTAAEVHVNKNVIPISELYRIGGTESVRGILDNSLLADRYGYSNIEYRYLYEEDSRLFAFTDIYWTENYQNETKDFSFGFGIQLKSPIGYIGTVIAFPGDFGFSTAIVHSSLTTYF